MSFYAWIILGSIVGPLLLSFDKKVHFIGYLKALLPAILMVGVVFLVWDQYFTQNGIWGFTPNYLLGIYLGDLPLEECLFFLVVPYSCIFIYEVIRSWFPRRKTALTARIFAFLMVFSGLYLGIRYMENWYTASACIGAAILIIGFHFVEKVRWFGDFALAFIVVLIPFLVVNGLLTGAATPEPVVWYNEEHIIGVRIITIPMEDIYYNLCMLLPVTALYEWWKKKLLKGKLNREN